MKIKACPRCGSHRIELSKSKAVIGVCQDCDFMGNFIEFDSEKEYQIFLDELKKEEYIRDKDEYIDPAESAPIRKYIKRSVVTWTIVLLTFVVALAVFALLYEVLEQSLEISIVSAFLSMLIYFYFVWKYELWNWIKR